MKDNGVYEDLSSIQKRAKTVLILIHILFICIVFLFWKIQILDHKIYWKRSENNRLRKLKISAQRGLIKDRFDNILVKNIASYNISVLRENITDYEQSLAKIAQLIEVEPEILKERIEKYNSTPKFEPIVIKENLTEEEVAQYEVRKVDFPELLIQSEPKRFYPQGEFASHVLGYLQEISRDELRSPQFSNHLSGDLVGKNGIEKSYETQLAGVKGHIIEIVDSIGRQRGEIEHLNPIPGKDLTLTIDSDIQKLVESQLVGKEGTIVVLNPRNGEILTLASSPNFNPNRFISRFTPKEWEHLIDDPENPLENRAIRGLYSPGSIFKLTMALAGLDTRLISENTRIDCSGEVVLYNNPFRCNSRFGHGRVDLFDSIRYSCNIYYYLLGKKLGIEKIAHYARLLGFGHSSGVDLPGEKGGLVPDKKWKLKERKERWYLGETISVSIGQGPILVTPIQIALHTALIANRGNPTVIPHFVQGEEKKTISSFEISKNKFEKVIKGMWQSVNMEGTGRAAEIKGFDVCGKTGSTQVISRITAEKRLEKNKTITKTHSWFAGFAPRYNPEIVVAIIVEHGGEGGKAAAPIAKKIFDLYKLKKQIYD